jgi:hypothetical protein
MRTSLLSLLLLAFILAGCGRQPSLKNNPEALTPAQAAQVVDGVRAFMQTVAHDVTQDGPAAWRKHFADSPAFFMASEGQMAFPDSTSATIAIHDLALDIKHIELVWGDSLRVDPLTPALAVVAAPWREVRVNAAGQRVEETGFFTGVTEYRAGRWQFRDVHWSIAPAPSPAH